MSGAAPLKDILKGIISRLEKDRGGEGPGVLEAWKKAVTAGAAKHTRPVSLKAGRLVVHVTDSSRLYNLTLEKQKIIRKLNGYLKKKKIKEIRFKIGEV